MTFVDPAPMGPVARATAMERAMTPALSLSDLLEMATDAYAEACDTAAQRENDYLRAYSDAFLFADCAATIRPKTADNQPPVVKARCEWNIAQAAEKAARAKVEELKHRLMAALGHQRFIREQT